MVHTPTSPSIPRNIYQAWLNKTAKRNIQLFIVQFYDKQESWLSSLCFLLIDGLAHFLHQGKVSHLINWSYWARIQVSAFYHSGFLLFFIFLFLIPYHPLELDKENLSSGAKQKWKASASKQQCQEAYEFVDRFVILKVICSYSFFWVSSRAMSEMIQSDDGGTSVDNDHL